MIATVIDVFNMLLRAGQNPTFQQEMEGVVIGFHCQPFPLQRWVVQQGKLQYLWRWAPCDMEISGTVAQWVALVGDRPMPKGGCQLRGETAYLKGLQAALESQKECYKDYLNEKVPAPVRSTIYTLRRMLADLLPRSPWLQRPEFEKERKKLQHCFDQINAAERRIAAQKKESDV